MRVKTNLEGEHNGEKFILHDGYLGVFGSKLTLQGVKTIVEIATLLKVQGYDIREKAPKLKRPYTIFDQMTGVQPEYYDENEEETK